MKGDNLGSLLKEVEEVKNFLAEQKKWEYVKTMTMVSALLLLLREYLKEEVKNED